MSWLVSFHRWGSRDGTGVPGLYRGPPGAGQVASFLPQGAAYAPIPIPDHRGQTMRTGILTAAGFAAALVLTGCGGKDDVQGKTGADISAKSSGNEIGEAYLNELTRVADALETVKDEDSAKAAAKKLKVAVDGLNAMQEKLDGKKMDGMVAMQMFGGRYSEFAEVQSRIAQSIVDIQMNHPELMETVSDELDRLEN